jgi:26S proteasome regulatory subunit N2
MILIQTSKAQEPRVEQIRKIFEEKIADKHEEIMSKYGAIIASGIIDAGGRNSTIALHSRSGHRNMSAIVGLAVFTQYWYWYPLLHFISLALTPTAIMGLNKDLKLPKYTFKSNARPSLFAYPPEVKPPAAVAPSKVSTAVLSYSRGKPAAKPGAPTKPAVDAMDISSTTPKDEKAKDETQKVEEKKEEEKKKEPEPTFEIKSNPARVAPGQLQHLSFDIDTRYTPVKTGEVFGIVLLHDNRAGEPEELVSPTGKLGIATTEEAEPEPPAPFQWTEQ